MYNYIKGRLAAKDPTFAVIDVNGVGYELKISLNTYAKHTWILLIKKKKKKHLQFTFYFF